MPIIGVSEMLNAKGKCGRNVKFTTICAWCGKTLSVECIWRDDPDAPDETSHGLCAECLAKQMAELDAEEEKK